MSLPININALPNDVMIWNVFPRLDFEDVSQCKGVCRKWNWLGNNYSLIFAKDFFLRLLREIDTKMPDLEEGILKVKLIRLSEHLRTSFADWFNVSERQESFSWHPAIGDVRLAISRLMLNLDKIPPELPFDFRPTEKVLSLDTPSIRIDTAENDHLKLFEALKVALKLWHPKGSYETLYALEEKPYDLVPLNPFLDLVIKKWAVKEARCRPEGIGPRVAGNVRRAKYYAAAIRASNLPHYLKERVALNAFNNNTRSTLKGSFFSMLPSDVQTSTVKKVLEKPINIASLDPSIRPFARKIRCIDNCFACFISWPVLCVFSWSAIFAVSSGIVVIQEGKKGKLSRWLLVSFIVFTTLVAGMSTLMIVCCLHRKRMQLPAERWPLINTV